MMCQFPGCVRPSDFRIYDLNETRPDLGVTDACGEHVGALLGSIPPTVPERWEVVAVPKQKDHQMTKLERFADPYKKCCQCGEWIDGVDPDVAGPLKVQPCGHRRGYNDVCPSWGPVDGCRCEPKGHGRTGEFPDGVVR